MIIPTDLDGMYADPPVQEEMIPTVPNTDNDADIEETGVRSDDEPAPRRKKKDPSRKDKKTKPHKGKGKADVSNLLIRWIQTNNVA